LLRQPLETVRAYDFSVRFDDFDELDDPDAAEEYLRRWTAAVRNSGLQPWSSSRGCARITGSG
jgi:transposase